MNRQQRIREALFLNADGQPTVPAWFTWTTDGRSKSTHLTMDGVSSLCGTSSCSAPKGSISPDERICERCGKVLFNLNLKPVDMIEVGGVWIRT